MNAAEHFAEAEWLLTVCAGNRGTDMDAVCTAAAQVHATLALAAELRHGRRDGGTEAIGGPHRQMSREWARIQPGVQGRLVSFGGHGDGAWAWIDVREEKP